MARQEWCRMGRWRIVSASRRTGFRILSASTPRVDAMRQPLQIVVGRRSSDDNAHDCLIPPPASLSDSTSYSILCRYNNTFFTPSGTPDSGIYWQLCTARFSQSTNKPNHHGSTAIISTTGTQRTHQTHNEAASRFASPYSVTIIEGYTKAIPSAAVAL